VTTRTLVAGVGNVFHKDDAFGVEVLKLLGSRPWPAGVEVADFGIGGVHLVYELLNGCDLFVLVDAAQRGREAGTVTVLEVGPADSGPAGSGPRVAVMDAHGLEPDAIFAMLGSMGRRPGRSLVVACEPADVSPGMGLSEPVRAALPHAVRAVEEILDQIQGEEGAHEGVHGD
jgi:hydrogenase maturation protease